MRKLFGKLEVILATIIFAGVVLSTPLTAFAGQDNDGSAVQSRLSKKQYQNVKATVSDGVATLTGTVDLYEYKADAQKTALHTKGVTAVRNQIEVTGNNISDAELQKKLVDKLSYDGIGFDHVFDAVAVKVQNGEVVLSGHAHNYVNRDSALALVATTQGVKDMVDDIEVDPVSPMDDQTRVATYRAVYGFTSLNKYAIDPAKPIRISVQNGHVELYGVVLSEADKNAAFIQANQVPGVFSVKNYLQVAGQGTERRQ